MPDDASPMGWASLFWAAFERSRNPMALLDSERVVLAINPALADMSGYSPEQVIGRRGDVFLAPEEWKRVDADWKFVMRSGSAVQMREVVRADGQHVRVQGVAQREEVTGRQLVLFVVINEQRKPLAVSGQGASGGQSLSPRELQIAGEIAMGRRAHEIADDLFIATTTVQTHARNAMRKVGARSQAQLVAILFARGLIDPELVTRK
jgi:PAS domain S-box-containing protein